MSTSTARAHRSSRDLRRRHQPGSRRFDRLRLSWFGLSLSSSLDARAGIRCFLRIPPPVYWVKPPSGNRPPVAACYHPDWSLLEREGGLGCFVQSFSTWTEPSSTST